MRIPGREKPIRQREKGLFCIGSDGRPMEVGAIICFSSFPPNVAFSRETGWRGLCTAQTVTDWIVGYNAWLCVPSFLHALLAQCRCRS